MDDSAVRPTPQKKREPLIEQRRATVDLFQVQQGAFALQAAAVAREAAVRADHPVARHDDRDRVMPIGQSHRARGPRSADLLGDASVRPRLPCRGCGTRYATSTAANGLPEAQE